MSPAGANWPDDNPQWSGSAGLDGTGTTNSTTLSAVSGTTTDYKKVTVACGNEVTTDIVVYDVNLLVRLAGTSNSFATSAALAAGGINSNEHKLDIRAQLSPALEGIALGELSVIGEGQDHETTLNGTFSHTSSTNALGRVEATYTSGNRFESATISMKMASHSSSQTRLVEISQVWNALTGTGAAWTGDNIFDIGDPLPITYVMELEDEIAITGHQINFETRSITGWEWNPDTPVDEDSDGIVDYYGAYDEDVTHTEDGEELNGVYSGLVTYGTTAESTAGRYSSTMTVLDYIGSKGYVDFFVDQVIIGVKDSTVYEYSE